MIAPLVEAAIVKLIVTERFQRLEAIQDRWDALREAKAAFAREDYEAAMKTGVVCRKVRWKILRHRFVRMEFRGHELLRGLRQDRCRSR